MQRLRGAGGFGDGARVQWGWGRGVGFGIRIKRRSGINGNGYIDARERGQGFCSLFRFTLHCFAYASGFLKTSMLLIGNLANSHTVREGGQIRQRLRGYDLGMRTAHVLLLGESRLRRPLRIYEQWDTRFLWR